MKKWWQFLIILLLGLALSIGFNINLQAQIAPSQLVRQGQKLYQTGKFEASLKLLQQAKEIYIGQKKYLQQAQIFSLIAQVQQQIGNLELAEKNIADSFAAIETIKPSKKKTQVLAQTWNTKGHLQFARGDNRQALEDWQKGEKLYRQLNDRLGINGSLLDRAQVLEKMGFYDRSCDRTLEALEHQDYNCANLDSPQIEAIINQVKKEVQPWQIKGLNQLSNILLFKGKLSEAEAVIQANQTISSSVANLSPWTEAKIILSSGNINKAIAFRAKEIADLSGFSSHSAKAIKYYQQLNSDQNPPQIALKYKLPAQLNLLSLFIETQQWQKAQNVVSQIQLHPDTLPGQRNLYGEIKFALDLERLKNKVDIEYSWQDIADIYLDAIERGKDIGDLRIQSYALGYLGVLQNNHNRLQLESTPETAIAQALNLALQARSSEIVYRWQWQLGKVYGQENYRDKALSYYRASLMTLTSLREDIASLAREVQFDFHEQIEPVYKEYVDLLLGEQSTSDEEISLAMDAIESLQIAELDNYFQDACIISDKKRIDQIDKNAAAIYTLIQPDHLEVIMATNNPVAGTSFKTFHRASISQIKLEKIVEQLRLYITEPDRSIEVQRLSAQLYDLLIRPFEADLERQKPKNLVFILDSILQTVPMSVLYDGEKYLLEKYAIALTPGLKILNLQDRGKERSFLAGGITKSLQVKQQKFLALDNVETEIKSVSQKDSKILLDKDFTVDNLLNQINFTSASHIHLATHAQFSSNPDKTFLLMWGELLNIKDFSDILQTGKSKISTPIELLVLSACDTALGDRYSALGLGGVAVRSGALSTIATLWQVNDKSTATLMKGFYQYLTEGYSKAEALRLAQLKLWEKLDQDWQVPAFWSAYIMIGNWQ